MIELQLSDGRVLTFEQGPRQDHVARSTPFLESFVTNISSDESDKAIRSGAGPDFLITNQNHPDSLFAVELKAGASTPTEATKRKWARPLLSHLRQLRLKHQRDIPLQLWFVTRDSQSLRTWMVNDEGDFQDEHTYYLARVSTTNPDTPDTIVDGNSKLDTSHVIQRVDDWHNRIVALYDNVQEWCAFIDPRLIAEQSGLVTMNEELMQRYGVPARELPMLHIKKDADELLTFKPYGLWVIGANGRIDLFSAAESYFLVDRAAQFQPARWQIYGSSGRRLRGLRLIDGIEWNTETLGALLNA